MADHESRGCEGIGLQSRPDFLSQRFSDHAYCYNEIKTTSQARRAWAESYERKLQIIIGAEGSERRYGVEIGHVMIEGLVKGSRMRNYEDRFDNDAPKRQQSFLCYGYYKPATGPGTIPDLMPSHEWYDREGIKATVQRTSQRNGEGHKKLGLWEIPDSEFPGKPEGMSKIEWWITYWQQNSPTTMAKALAIIGPIPKPRIHVEAAKRAYIVSITSKFFPWLHNSTNFFPTD